MLGEIARAFSHMLLASTPHGRNCSVSLFWS
uniref:Uncharacterized protein n=1 Tax=Arundo donax TaxID=35708 RepID=A0A0A9AS76_ARUDO